MVQLREIFALAIVRCKVQIFAKLLGVTDCE